MEFFVFSSNLAWKKAVQFRLINALPLTEDLLLTKLLKFDRPAKKFLKINE